MFCFFIFYCLFLRKFIYFKKWGKRKKKKKGKRENVFEGDVLNMVMVGIIEFSVLWFFLLEESEL